MTDTSFDTDTNYAPTGKIITETQNWMRNYRLRIYIHNSPTITYPQPQPNSAINTDEINSVETDGDLVVDVSNLWCTFTVARCAYKYANQAQIRVYNLTPALENAIIMQGYHITLEAGYGTSDTNDNFGQIFDGTVLQCTRSKQNGTDFYLDIVALDGEAFLDSAYCSFTYTKGQTMRDVVNNIVTKAATPINIGYISPYLDTVPMAKGGVVHGLAKNALSTLAQSINGTWFVDNGKLFIISYSTSVDDLPMGKQAVELGETTGLLGTPQFSNMYLTAQCLLNPQIQPYSLIHINNELILQGKVSVDSSSGTISNPTLVMLDPQGIYRVFEVVFQGDTRGNDWFCNITAVTQNGGVPEALAIGGTLS